MHMFFVIFLVLLATGTTLAPNADGNPQVRIRITDAGEPAIEIRGGALPGEHFEIAACTNLTHRSWQVVTPAFMPAADGVMTWIDTNSGSHASRFYRVGYRDADAFQASDTGEISPYDTGDMDGDGLTDAFEIAHGFNPASPSGESEADADTDGDGLPDALEMLFFGDLSQHATNDWDQDGLLNIEEFAILSAPPEPYAFHSPWIETPPHAVLPALSDSDEGYVEVELGFAMPFFNNRYSSLHAGANGTASFGGAYGGYYLVAPIPNGSPHAFTAPFWGDLEIINGHMCHFPMTNQTGFAHVITWNSLSFYSRDDTALTFQAELQESGRIIFRYAEMEYAGRSAEIVIGTQGDSGTDGRAWLYSTDPSASVTNGLAICFPAAVSKVVLHSYPDAIDSDLDGMDDRYESGSLLLDPLDPADAAADWDTDGLSHLLEYQNGTGIDLADSDGDGFADGVEVALGFSPVDPEDPDRDHLADSDRDGMADVWELYCCGGLEAVPYGDADGDGLCNLDEYWTGSNPRKADSDADGLHDGTDEFPLRPGPRITITQPLENAVVAGSTLQIKGTIDFVGTLERVTVNGREASFSETDGCRPFTATIDTLREGDQTFTVTAVGHHRDTELQGVAEVSISADVMPPALQSISVPGGAVMTNRYLHFTVQTDDPAAVFIDGETMARDGYLNYGWVELSPGTNCIVIASTDLHGRTATQQVAVVCDAPPGASAEPPADADRDGVLDVNDYAPDDPTVQSPISITSVQNGWTIQAASTDKDLQDIRTIQLEGIAPAAPVPLDVYVHSENGIWGSDRFETTDVNQGRFSLPVRLFPGANTITVSDGQFADRCRLTLMLSRPRLDVRMSWRNKDDAWRDADMHNVPTLNTIPLAPRSCVYDDSDPEGWRRHAESSVPYDSQPAHWVETDALSTVQALYAGVYRLTFSAGAQNGYGWYDKLDPKPVHYDYSVSLDGTEILADSITLNPVITSREFIGSPWNYWKVYGYYRTETVSFAVHADGFAGGYIVDDGYRDLCPQGMECGTRTFIPGLFETTYPYRYETAQLTGPDGVAPVFLKAFQSSPFTLQGVREGLADPESLCANLTVYGGTSNAQATVDATGVFSALAPGHCQVGIRENSIMKPDGTLFTTNDIPPMDIFVIDPRIIPDYDRDGMIDNRDRQTAAAFAPLRFWINDDDDEGDIAVDDSDVPGQGSLLDNANCDDSHINGRCDLLDFFPVRLDLHDTLAVLPTGDGVEYRLRHADEAIRMVYTGLTANRANEYRTLDGQVYGPNLDQDAFNAATLRVSDSGIVLNSVFLESIAEDPDKGILLIEGIRASNQPLVLEIRKAGRTLLESRLRLSLTGVEQMYRWINLRHVVGADENRPTDLRQPANFPDTASNGKQFVFVHGYSVHETAARAWNAEMFKRLYQSGSQAMFTAVTWQGNDSQLWGWIPFIGGATPDYYQNVENAFATAPRLAALMPELPGEKIIAGHSLGNMVVSSAITDHGLAASTYFMLNAAVAMEAYNENFSHPEQMCHPEWQSYSNRLWAADWHKLFPGEDSRNKLTWRDRFGEMTQAINYYSSTEDVLANANGNVPALGRVQAWACQEMRKGTILMWIAPGNAEAGWGFNDDYDLLVREIDGGYVRTRLPPEEADGLPDSAIRTNSFFMRFDNDELYGEWGDDFLLAGEAEVRNSPIFRRLLADAVPALSNPAGRNPLGNAVSDNMDVMLSRRGIYDEEGWPRDTDEWRHSDIKNIAFPYNYTVFNRLTSDGGLK